MGLASILGGMLGGAKKPDPTGQQAMAGLGSGGMASAGAAPAHMATPTPAAHTGFGHGLGMVLGGQQGSAGYQAPHGGQAATTAPAANSTLQHGPTMGHRIGTVMQNLGQSGDAQQQVMQQGGGMGQMQQPQYAQANLQQYNPSANAVSGQPMQYGGLAHLMQR